MKKITLAFTIFCFSSYLWAQSTPVTTCVSIDRGRDDVEESTTNGSISRGSSDLELGDNVIGLRFNNIDVPQGATIVSAFLQFTVDERTTGTSSLLIQGESTDNAPFFNRFDTFNVSERTPTVASVPWSPPAWNSVGSAGPDQSSPDIRAIVQEIVNRPGYTMNNSMVMIITGTGTRTAESFNGLRSGAPELCITYSNCPPAGTVCDDGDPNTENDVEDGNCNCAGTPIGGPTGSETVCMSIGNGADDVEQSNANGAMYFDSTDLEIISDQAPPPNYDGADQTIGLRFNNIAVPQGATIVNAFLQFTSDETGGGASSLVIHGESADNAAAFANVAFNVSNRATTAASVAWSPPAWNTVGNAGPGQGTDIGSIVQEIVNRPGYALNNSMVLIITGTGTRTAESFDGLPGGAPQLCITYAINCAPAGTSCDDGNPNTENDVEDGNCNCAGTPVTGGSSISFAAIGDFGSGSSNQGNVANLIANLAPDLIITAGDNRYGSLTMDQTIGQFYCDFLNNAGFGPNCSGGNSATNLFFPSTGNHEYTDGGGINEYLNYFDLPGNNVPSSNTSGSELYYDFVRGPVHFFTIDSYATLNSSAEEANQKNWLQTQLAASSSPWKVVFFHHSPYSSGSEHGSNPLMQWPFAAWGADAVISGHDHHYERIESDGIPYFITGLGGAEAYAVGAPVMGSQVRYSADFGTMFTTATTNLMTFQFINVNGTVIDSYTIENNPSCLPAGTPCDDGDPNTENDVEDGNCNCAGTPAGVVSVCVSIGNGADDVEQSNANGAMYFDSTDLEITSDQAPPPNYDGADQTIGLRFNNIAVPQGATIVNAFLQFTSDETGGGASSLVIHGESADNAAAFANVAFNVSNRATTAASVAWSPPAWNTVGNAGPGQGTDIGSIVQEIVNRPGYALNNSMVLIITGTGTRTAESFDGLPGGAPQLCITYAINCAPAGTSCDDGNPNTENDVEDGNCNCAGTSTCPAVGTPCDDGDPNTENDVEDGDCNCAGTPIGGPTESETVCMSIGNGADDVEQSNANGAMYFDSTDLEITSDLAPPPNYDGADQTIGLRFNNIAVPQGATIVNAFLQFTSDETGGGASSLVIHGESADNAAAFANVAFNVSNRATTAASVAWSPPAWNTVGNAGPGQGTDIGSIVQEIVNRPGYALNNSMVLIITGTGTRTAESFDGLPGGAPQLCITYAINCAPAGTSCDDGNPNTENDVEDGNCNCAGTSTCPAVGTPCDDGDPNTENDVEDGDCNCAGTPIGGPTESEVCMSIGNGADDVEQSNANGAMYFDSTDLEITSDLAPPPNYDGADQTIGLRFNNIAVPQGATIVNAFLQFTSDETGGGASSLVIRGESADNAAAFANVAFNISNRATTAASVAWSPPAWNTVGNAGPGQGTDIGSIVQEIVNRPGYALNNSMVLIITGTGTRTAESFDGLPGGAPQLCITYAINCAPAGTSCDDGNPNTENDVEDGNCNCAGTPIGLQLSARFVENTDIEVDESTDGESLELFPSPAKEELNIILKTTRKGEWNVKIHDISGRLTQTNKFNASLGTQIIGLDVSSLSPGLYLLTIEMGDVRLSTKFAKY